MCKLTKLDKPFQYYNEGLYKKAKKQFNKALNLNQDHEDSLINLSSTYTIFGKFSNAVKGIPKILKESPNSPLLINIGLKILLSVNKKDYLSIVKMLSSYIRLEQGSRWTLVASPICKADLFVNELESKLFSIVKNRRAQK